jgi:DNA-binding NtrC family response regulator
LDDVPQIIDFMLQRFEQQKRTRARKVSAEAMALLRRYKWPGNVRELENVMYRAAVVAQGDAILIKDLPSEVQTAAGPAAELGATTSQVQDDAAATPPVSSSSSGSHPGWIVDLATATRVLMETARRESPEDPWRWLQANFEGAGLAPAGATKVVRRPKA